MIFGISQTILKIQSLKKILVIQYSQSGQLTEIVTNIVKPMRSEDTEFTYLNIEMENPFPFPWTKASFFGVFPETFLQKPQPVKPIPNAILKTDYDLIILGYSVWYLSPSLPTTSFLNTDEAKLLFSNAKVITVIGCRNMWIMAHEKLKKKLKELKAELVGHIVLADRHLNHVSVITISHWMFSGKKTKYLGIFPKPGVSQKDIDESTKFGHVIKSQLKTGSFENLQNKLLEVDAVKVKSFLVLVEKRATLLFSKWATLINRKIENNQKKRQFWTSLFNYYLLFAIWCIAPLVFILFLIFYLPNLNRIKKQKAYYSSVELK